MVAAGYAYVAVTRNAKSYYLNMNNYLLGIESLNVLQNLDSKASKAFCFTSQPTYVRNADWQNFFRLIPLPVVLLYPLDPCAYERLMLGNAWWNRPEIFGPKDHVRNVFI